MVDEEHQVNVAEPTGDPVADFDWSLMDKAIGRETPTNVTHMSLEEFMKVM